MKHIWTNSPRKPSAKENSFCKDIQWRTSCLIGVEIQLVFKYNTLALNVRTMLTIQPSQLSCLNNVYTPKVLLTAWWRILQKLKLCNGINNLERSKIEWYKPGPQIHYCEGNPCFIGVEIKSSCWLKVTYWYLHEIKATHWLKAY